MDGFGFRMVTRSTDNYEQHKKEIYEIIKSKVGERKAKKFIEFYSLRYDKFNRSFIDYKLAYALMDDYYHVNKIGTRWYAFVGVGGTGKSTLAKNVSYFLDDKFSLKYITTDMDEFIKILSTLKIKDVLRSVLLDEPDDQHASNSKRGKIIRKIFGKIRQQKTFISICATDLTDIPNYIYRKLDGIFFCSSLGKYMFFKNKPRKKSYIIQEIRRKYQIYGYKTFFQLSKQVGCSLGDTIKFTPLDSTEKEYLKEKRKDYEKDITHFLKGDYAKEFLGSREKKILTLREKGLTHKEISERIGLARSRITQILNKIDEVNG